MARDTNDIITQMDAQQASEPALSGLNSPSQSGIYRLWKFLTASMENLHEQLWDIFKVELETTAANAPVGTEQWVQAQSFKFQYSPIALQLVNITNFIPGYDPVDTTLQIITRCSVKTLPSRTVSVKVAKSNPPQALTTGLGGELFAFQGYLDVISFAGVQYNIISAPADQMFLEANIYYDGQYASVIQQNVIDAINNYLLKLPFDGIVKVSAVEDAIQAVAGVKDVTIINLRIRSNATTFANGYKLVDNFKEVSKSITLFAGYAIGETTTGQTFTDKLNFIVA
jgi:hypothetical protein